MGLLAAAAFAATAQADDNHQQDANIHYMLLVSVDGLHALDVANYVESHPNSALAELSRKGVTYTNVQDINAN